MSKYPGRIVTDLAPAGYSVFFDGTGDYLNLGGQSAFSFGTGDWTVEFWMNFSATGGTLFDTRPAGTASTNGYSVLFLSSGSVRYDTASGVKITGSTLSANTWYHVALSKASGITRLFINGVQDGSSYTDSVNYGVGGNRPIIGADGNIPTTVLFTGYLSNYRIVKGVGVYTAAFTPPTQLFNVTNTQLLTCNSPAIIDQSNNAFAITTNGDARVSTFTPFTAYVPYNPALGASTPGVWTLDEALQAKGTRQWNMYDPYFNLTTLLLHGNGTNTAQNNQFLDSSSNNFTITRNPASGPNAPTQGSFSPFSQTGWSNYFAAGTDYLIVTAGAGQAFGTGDFTVECWLYTGATACNIMMPSAGTNTWGFLTFSNQLYWQFNGGNIFSGGTVPQNSWVHLAVSRTSSSTSGYVNGTRVFGGTASNDTNNYSATPSRNIGPAGGGGVPFYVSNARIVKGTGLYSGASITVPTAPLNSIPNTEFLFCNSNRFVDSNTATTAKAVTINGSPSVQPFSPFYPTAAYTPATVGGSVFLDGTGDYLSFTGSIAISGQFSAECWFYRTATGAAQQTLFAFNSNNTSYASIRIDTDGNGNNDRNITLNISTNGTSWNTFAVNSIYWKLGWNHVVATRDGSNNVRLFLNGVLINTVSAVAGALFSTSTTHSIGCNTLPGTATNLFTGYISDVRLVNGSIPTTYQTSSTTTNAVIFTPPSAPLTTTSQGATASNVTLLTNFTNAGIVDSTAKNALETVGNAQISTTQSKFGGTSMYFDGTGDYLQTAPSQLFNVGASDFTIEFWIYPTSFAATSYPIYSASARAKADCIALETNTSGVINAYVTASGGAAWSIVSAGNVGTLTLNTWNHVALVRNGSAFRGYVNGVQGGMTTSSSSAVASFDGWNIGFNGASAYFTGYIDDLRITRFARYTANFTPQTSQWQDE